MIEALKNAVTLPDLRRKLLYTLLILIIYRLAAHVPVPGVDQAALDQLLDRVGLVSLGLEEGIDLESGHCFGLAETPLYRSLRHRSTRARGALIVDE